MDAFLYFAGNIHFIITCEVYIMKRSIKELCIRMFILFIGLCIAHFGVTLFLLADLGSDPFNVLVQGIFRTLQRVTGWEFLTHGYTHIGINLLIILILLFVDRTYIKIGTIFCMAFGGPIIDFFTIILGGFLNAGNPFIIRLITLACGCLILAYGMTVVMKSDAGTGPNDLVAIAISDKGHFPFGITRTVTDISFVLVGFLLGGKFGIGTIVCACLVGMIAERFLPINEKIINRILKI